MSDAPETVPVVTEPVVEAPAEESPAEAPKEEESAEAPVEAPKDESAKEEPAVEASELVKNVKEMLSSTEGKSVGDLENRVKVLEEKLDKLIGVLKTYRPDKCRLRNIVNDI